MIRQLRAPATAVLICLILCSCAGRRPGPGPVTPVADRAVAEAGAVDLASLPRTSHVLVVTVDGLRADLVTPDRMPALFRLASEGIHARRAETVVPSMTLPSHASLVTGLDPRQHQVLWNDYRPEYGSIELRTIFTVAHEAGRRTCLFAGKEKLQQLARPEQVDMISARLRGDREVMDEALGYIAAMEPHLCLIHLPGVDFAGHAFGWGSGRQEHAVAEADAQLLRLVRWIRGRPDASDWAMIVTADHGGRGRHHGGGTADELRIPWIMWKPGVAPGILPRVSIEDTAKAVLTILGLPASGLDRSSMSPGVDPANPTTSATRNGP